MRDSFTFYRSFGEAAAMLDDKQRLELYDALTAYALDGEEKELTGALAGMMMLIRPVIDANTRRAENGNKGGRKPKVSDDCETKKPMVSDHFENEKPMVSNHFENEKPMVSDHFGIGKPDKEEEEDKDKESESEKEEEEDNARARVVFVLADGSEWYPTEGKLKEYRQAFPAVDVRGEILRCIAKHNSTDRRKNVTNIERYVVNWLINAQAEAAKRGNKFSDFSQREQEEPSKLLEELRERNGNLI